MPLAVHPEALAERLRGLMAERRVLPQRGRRAAGPRAGGLRDVADAVFAAVANAAVGDVVALSSDRAGCDVPGSDDRIDQFGLAVALDTGDADDLAAVHGER